MYVCVFVSRTYEVYDCDPSYSGLETDLSQFIGIIMLPCVSHQIIKNFLRSSFYFSFLLLQLLHNQLIAFLGFSVV